MTVDTRTTERVESTVETVEIEETRCPICEQWYQDDGELVAVAVGATYEPDGEIVTAAHDTRVCTACTASLFDVEPEPGRLDRVQEALQRPLVDLGDVSVPTGAVRTVVSMGIGLAVTGIVANTVINEMATQVEPGEIEQVGAPLPFLEFLPLLVLGLLVVAAIRVTATIGPRGGFR